MSNPSTFDLFTDVTGDKETPNWYMCVTMAFGSMIAGASSEVGKLITGIRICCYCERSELLLYPAA